MRTIGPIAAGILLLLTSASILQAQDKKVSNLAAAPSSVVLLVHQEIPPGRVAEHHKLEVALSRACDRLDAPSFWIDLQPITGQQEALLFDPFDSFEHMGQSNAEWGKFFAAHPDLARMQEEIEGLVVSEHTTVAVRRDDLGFRADSIDLSEARFVRVLEVRLFPGHESDFVDAFKILGDAYTKIQADIPWVVYQVDVGTTTPAFLVFMPMSDLRQNDDFLSWNDNLIEAEGEQAAEKVKQIARGAYATTESNLYAVNPGMSHVSDDFAASDPDFWIHPLAPEIKSDEKTAVKPSVKRSNKLP